MTGVTFTVQIISFIYFGNDGKLVILPMNRILYHEMDGFAVVEILNVTKFSSLLNFAGTVFDH